MTTPPTPGHPSPDSAASPAAPAEHHMSQMSQPSPHDTGTTPPQTAAASPLPPSPSPGARAPDGTAGSAPRLGTLVWGLVLLMLGIVVVALALVGDQLDIQLALIAVLTVAGVGMLIGALLQARR